MIHLASSKTKESVSARQELITLLDSLNLGACEWRQLKELFLEFVSEDLQEQAVY